MDEMDTPHGPETPSNPDLPTDGEKDWLDREWEIMGDSFEAHIWRLKAAMRELWQQIQKSLGLG